MKKIFQLMGIGAIFIFIFFSNEYLIYTLYLKESLLYVLAFILFLAVFRLNIFVMEALKLQSSKVAILFVLACVFLGLILLKYLLPVLN